MSEDARFEDARETPLRLRAVDAEDLPILSSLVQDAVFSRADMAWRRDQRRFAILLNRFRWEDADAARQRGRPFERVRAMLVIDDVLAVRTQGIKAGDTDAVFSLLSLAWEAGEDASGALILHLAGDGAVRVEVEALEVVLRDVTRPYVAPSRRAPRHD